MAFGAQEPVDAVLEEALATAGRDELPDTGQELIAFVRAHLLAPLSDHIGPRLTMALVDDLVAQLDPGAARTDPSVPPSSMPRPIRSRAPASGRPGARGILESAPVSRGAPLGVLLVDDDRVGRTVLARALLRASCQVTVVDTTEDLTAALGSGDAVDVALVDAVHPAARAIVEVLGRDRPSAAVVARSNDPIHTRALLSQLGVTTFDVRSREAPAEELIDAIRRTVGT
jgi:CheY-like chemotaxis protein